MGEVVWFSFISVFICRKPSSLVLLYVLPYEQTNSVQECDAPHTPRDVVTHGKTDDDLARR